jgi:hypothetical protein
MDTPTLISLRQIGSVAFQGDEGACVQNYLYNTLLYQTTISGRPFAIDRQVSYQSLLNAEGFPNSDHGTTLSVAWAQAKTVGFTTDTGLYGAYRIGIQPTAAQYADAKTHTVLSMTHINPAEVALSYLSSMIVDLINQRQPVGIAFVLREGFMTNSGVNSGAPLGGHEVTAVGASVVANKDGTNHTILEVESWGPQYADNGRYKLDLQASFGTQASKLDFISADSVNGFNGQDWHGDANAVNVAELYNGILKRAPETAAFSSVSAALTSGSTPEDVAGWLIGSAEFQRQLPAATNAQFVTYLFENMQNREPLAGGLAFWTAYLDGGGSRAHLAVQMMQNTQDTAEWAYNIFVGSNPVLRTASDFLYNRAVASIDLSLHMQATSASSDLLHSVIAAVTPDPNSVQTALQGVPELLGHILPQTISSTPIHLIGLPHSTGVLLV